MQILFDKHIRRTTDLRFCHVGPYGNLTHCIWIVSRKVALHTPFGNRQVKMLGQHAFRLAVKQSVQ